MKTKQNLKKGRFNWLLKYFRPHIVEIDGKFYVRRFRGSGYEHLGVIFWWSYDFKHNAEFSTLEQAEERFNKLKESLNLEKNKNKETIIKIL